MSFLDITRVRHLPRTVIAAGVLSVLALSAPVAHSQFDPSRTTVEPQAIVARYPDPDVRYGTPGLREARKDFASHAEVLSFVDALAKTSKHVRIESIGRSQRGLAMPLIVLSETAIVDDARPTVMIIGQQHGNEPAGGEAALALAEQLAGPQSALLERQEERT